MTVLRVSSVDDMQIDKAVVEVIEYDDPHELVVRVCEAAAPGQLLHALETVEDVIDEPARLGAWHESTAGRWRGLTLLP